LQLPLLFDTLQTAPQKIDLQCLTADFPFQFGHLAVVGPALSVASKGLHTVFLDVTAPAVQHVRVDFARLGHLGYRDAQSRRRTASSLNSLVNFRRVPMTQFSIR